MRGAGVRTRAAHGGSAASGLRGAPCGTLLDRGLERAVRVALQELECIVCLSGFDDDETLRPRA